MGSVASCNASMSLLKKIDISKKEPNTLEEIGQFKKCFYKELSYKKLYNNDDIYDVDEFVEYLYDNFIESTKFIDIIDSNGKSIFDKISDGKEFLTCKELYNILDEILNGIETVNRFTKDSLDDCTLHYLVDLGNADLTYVDLNILNEYKNDLCVSDSVIELYDNRVLSRCSSWIYCNNDNLSFENFTITQEFIDSLKPGDILELSLDGDGEHC